MYIFVSCFKQHNSTTSSQVTVQKVSEFFVVGREEVGLLKHRTDWVGVDKPGVVDDIGLQPIAVCCHRALTAIVVVLVLHFPRPF